MTPWARRGLRATVAAVGAMTLVPSWAPATVEEQRARLPPPAVCADGVEGVWVSHMYEAPWDEWMIFTLEVRRDPRGAAAPTVRGVRGRIPLVGRIEAHAWFGAGPTGSAPPACTDTRSHWIVEMPGEGFIDGMRLEFWGTQWRVKQVLCGPSGFGYNLDHFTGTIDPAIQEFQSVNNDGGRSVNDPRVFRRVQCLAASSPPHPYVAPPAFQPPQRAGCSR